MNYNMETDRHKFLDKAEPENEPAGICSFSWGNRELRIFGEQMTLQVNGISHDMTSVLDELRDIGQNRRRQVLPDGYHFCGESRLTCRGTTDRL